MNHQPASVGRLVGACDLVAIGELFHADIGRRVLREGECRCEEGEGEGKGEETWVGHLHSDARASASICARGSSLSAIAGIAVLVVRWE